LLSLTKVYGQQLHSVSWAPSASLCSRRQTKGRDFLVDRKANSLN
jgi:hypothetical protein